MANPILNTKMYAKITGIALAAVALLGIVLNAMGQGDLLGFDNDSDATTGFLVFDWTHNIVHVVLAAIALYIGFVAPANLAGLYAKVFGIVYFALGVTGFFVADLVILHLELGENLVHILIGAWGIVAGFFGTTATTTTTTTTTKPTTTTPARK